MSSTKTYRVTVETQIGTGIDLDGNRADGVFFRAEKRIVVASQPSRCNVAHILRHETGHAIVAAIRGWKPARLDATLATVCGSDCIPACSLAYAIEEIAVERWAARKLSRFRLFSRSESKGYCRLYLQAIPAEYHAIALELATQMADAIEANKGLVELV